MPMDELENLKHQKQSAHIIPLGSNVHVHQNRHTVYSDVDGLVFKVERSNSGPENVYDLESGIQVNEPETSDRNLFGRVGCNSLSLFRIVNGSIGAHVGGNGIQCGAVQGKESEMGFSFHHNTMKDSYVPVVARQSQDMGLAKAVNADSISVCCEKVRHENGNPALKPSWKKPPRPPSRAGKDSSRERNMSQDMGLEKAVNADSISVCCEKVRHENGNPALKPSWKKPPRPPSRAGKDSSRERNMKGISDTVLSRRAKLQRLRSMRKHKSAERSSAKTSFWAMLVTISFVVIMIMQGIFSQGTDSPQNSSPRLEQTNPVSLHDFASHGSSNGSGQAREIR